MKWAEAYQQIREHHYRILDERESISKSARLSLSTWVLELLTECLDEAEQTELNSSEKPNNCKDEPQHGYMWTCSKCGLEVHSDYGKCPRCGELKDEPKTCGSCKHMGDYDWCNGCYHHDLWEKP